MRFLVRNLHVFVFAFFSLLAAIVVSGDPQQAVKVVRPLVEDAVELKNLAHGAYTEVRQVSWRKAADEAVSLYVATMRMPTMLFERLAERLQEVEKKMSHQAKGDTLALAAESLQLRKVSFEPVGPSGGRNQFPGVARASAGPHL
ncbi:hypothetical protein ABLO27_02500 [Roseibium sp. SCPC15]|uniref:hypothetical protein n=1 Tax=Roseibium sp. SCP15 TaxID=3141376 RepID=UPI00333B09A5